MEGVGRMSCGVWRLQGVARLSAGCGRLSEEYGVVWVDCLEGVRRQSGGCGELSGWCGKVVSRGWGGCLVVWGDWRV